MLKLITAPVSAQAPYGADAVHEPEFDLLKAEMAKLGGIDSALVERCACAILAGKSKDLRALSFLAYASLRREQWDMFGDVFEGLAHLCETAFEQLFPARMHGRYLALQWLNESKFTDALGEQSPDVKHHDHIGRLVNALERLGPLFERHFPERSPFPAALYRSAVGWNTMTSVPVVAASSPASQPGTAPTALETPAQALRAVRKAALFLIEREPTTGSGYRLLRTARWEQLLEVPPSDNGVIRLEGPPAQLRAALAAQVSAGEWQALLARGEQVFATKACHLWLDLQRYAAVACEKIGESHKDVAGVIAEESTRLLARVPQLRSLRFADTAPLCDEQTAQWFDALESSFVKTTNEARSESERATMSDVFEQQRREVVELAAAGRLSEAVGKLCDARQTCVSRQEHFRYSIQMAAVLRNGAHPQVAIAVLEALEEKIAWYHLDCWDPGLALEALIELLHAYRAVRQPSSLQLRCAEKQPALLEQICRIDPVRALELGI